MNKERRKTLDSANKELEVAKGVLESIDKEKLQESAASAKALLAGIDKAALVAHIEDAKSQVEEAKDGEQEAFDNLSEGLQQGERGSRMEEVVSVMADFDSDADTVVENINDLLDVKDDEDVSDYGEAVNAIVSEIDDLISKVEDAQS